jgi:hypothetical protein
MSGRPYGVSEDAERIHDPEVRPGDPLFDDGPTTQGGRPDGGERDPELRPFELARVLGALWGLRFKLLLVFLVSLLIGLTTVFNVSFIPPKLEERTLGYGTGSSTVLLDSARSPLRDADEELEPLAQRAQLYTNLMTSDRMAAVIADRLEVPRDSVVFNVGQLTDPASRAQAVGPEIRANSLVFEGARYRFLVSAPGGLPLIQIEALAPSAKDARRAARVAASALVADVESAQRRFGDPRTGNPIEARVLGRPIGSEVTEDLDVPLAVGVTLLSFAGLSILLLALTNLISGLRAGAWRPEARDPAGHAQQR